MPIPWHLEDLADPSAMGNLEDPKAMAQWAKKTGPMDPIVWEAYELEHKMPEFWKNLKKDFPNAKKRIHIKNF